VGREFFAHLLYKISPVPSKNVTRKGLGHGDFEVHAEADKAVIGTGMPRFQNVTPPIDKIGIPNA
jgi:hypothetical protein